MIPLGGFVKIPGMHRPAPADVDPVFGRAVEEAPELAGAADRLRRSLGAGDHDAARDSLATFAELAAERPLSEQAAHGVEKGVTDIGDALGPDAYWRAAHLEARARDLRRARPRTSSSRSSSSPGST